MKRIFAGILVAVMALSVGCAAAPIETEPVTEQPTFDIAAQLVEADRLFLEGNYEEVILTLETVLEIEPANARGYLRLSDAYLARGERDKALALLQQGLEQSGDEEIAQRIQGMTEVIDGIVDVSGGDEHALLLNDDGDVYYIGNMKKSVGRIEYNDYALMPQKIEGLSDVRSIGAGYRGFFFGSRTDFAITADGELYVWGPDAWHFFPIGHNVNKPALLMQGVQDAFVTDTNLYAVKTDGELLALGQNHDGQLGDGSDYTEDYYSEHIYSGEDLGTSGTHVMDGVRKVTAGYGMYNDDVLGISNGCVAFAVDEAGVLYGWGTFGIKEEDGRVVKICFNEPVELARGVMDMDCSNNDLYIVTEEGVLQKTNLAAIGQDGPVWATVACGDIPVETVSCGAYHFCVTDVLGQVFTGGWNSSGQLGVSVQNTGNNQEGGALQPLDDTRVHLATAGRASNYAITGDGVLLAWGNNDYGQLGNGRRGSQKNAPEPAFVMSGVDKVYSGAREAYFIMENGDLYISGSGDFVSCATGGAAEEAFTPIKIMEDVSMVETRSGGVVKNDNTLWLPTSEGYKKEMDDVIYYAYSSWNEHDTNHWVIRTDNSLWGWGANHSGELGLGWMNDVGAAEDRSVAEPTKIMENVSMVSVASFPASYGQGSACFMLTGDGELFHCGKDYKWDSASFVTTPRRIAKDVAHVFAYMGMLRMFYTDTEGDLYQWGLVDNDLVYSTSSANYTSDTERTSIWGNVAKAKNGILLDKDGKCFVFGGQVMVEMLGLDESQWAEKAAVFGVGQLICEQMLEDVKDIASAMYVDMNYYAVKTNGDLYAWGDNLVGQLGLGESGSEESIFEVKLP